MVPYLLLLLLISSYSLGQDIDSGNTSTQSGDLNSNYQGAVVDSNNTSTTNSEVYNGAGSSSEIPVASAVAPSLMSGGDMSCLRSVSGGVSTLHIGISSGKYEVDKGCERRRDALVLNTLSMKVAAISRMCESDEVWLSLFQSGTPCPVVVNGKVVAGKTAYLTMKRAPEMFVRNYEENKEYFKVALGINGDKNGEAKEAKEDIDSESISKRFRTTKW